MFLYRCLCRCVYMDVYFRAGKDNQCIGKVFISFQNIDTAVSIFYFSYLSIKLYFSFDVNTFLKIANLQAKCVSLQKLIFHLPLKLLFLENCIWLREKIIFDDVSYDIFNLRLAKIYQYIWNFLIYFQHINIPASIICFRYF